ncbi:hypothetical protein [Nodosilinea sp. E11]|uniref:hypothetical protein n=1 Tax=Nodosilinea sp. E11 TaxID=3037479 RepID=UPI002935295D|nr:hypothetical protein [Nodosilinea sp. E11]WOD36895.1 hypothetical protein RRF56_00035 [Nodosilinea sp. E11]WOD37257.1 hypothetical protein RRF56_02010 [Nodosilinea sp. E11]
MPKACQVLRVAETRMLAGDCIHRCHSGLRSPTVTTNSQSIGVVDPCQRDRQSLEWWPP